MTAMSRLRGLRLCNYACAISGTSCAITQCMAKHTPTIELEGARAALSAARDACPHWDYESDGDAHEECCYRVDEAKLRYREAKAAVARTY